MSGFVKAGFSFLKNLGKGQKTTGTEVIKSVKPNVPKPMEKSTQANRRQVNPEMPEGLAQLQAVQHQKYKRKPCRI